MRVLQGTETQSGIASCPQPTASVVVQANGSSDYFEAYINASGGSSLTGSGKFSGGMLAPLTSGTVAGTGSAGYVPVWTSGNAVTYDSTANGQFAWDLTNHRLGIGTTAPGQKLTVVGTIESTSGGVKFPDGTTQTTAASAIPTGAVMAFDLASCPSGWTEYTAARGRFIRGIDSTGANDPDGARTLGSTQNDAFQGHSHDAQGTNTQDSGMGTYITRGSLGSWGPQAITAGSIGGPAVYGSNGTPRTANETRPKNVALLYCRKN